MARPQKSGLDYFPLDVNIDQDDKIMLIESEFGIVGFAITIKMLCKIYDNGYFYEWGEKEQLIFSKRINVNINEVIACINSAIKWGLFDKDLYEKHNVLSSKAIQKRYLEAVSRRKSVDVVADYLLVDIPKTQKNTINLVNVDINKVNVNINYVSDEVNDDISTQSKVKESKVKESKVKESIGENNIINIEQKKKEKDSAKELEDEFEEVWSLYPKKQGKANAFKAYVKARKDNVNKETIIQSIYNYIAYVDSIEWLNYKNGSTWFNQNCWNDDYTLNKKDQKPQQQKQTGGNPFFDLLKEEGKM